MTLQLDVSRRQFMKIAAATGIALPTLSFADDFEENRGSRVRWGRMQFDVTRRGLNDWFHHPEGDLNMIERLRQITNVNLEFDWGTPSVADLDDMVRYPFIFMHAQQSPALSDQQRDNMREYLRRGGFLYIDDCVLSYSRPDVFFNGMRRDLEKIFPDARFVKLKKNHDIFRCVYPMRNGLPHMQGRDHGLWGVYHRDRLIAVMGSGDLHCAWAQWFGPSDEQLSLQMGANIYVYAMTH
ncbi:MAG: hypothetical protein CMJ49_02020 [Planctomycetaceae bacterium]|nr:hypothetical protein [Planctomycetaceae bacterium]